MSQHQMNDFQNQQDLSFLPLNQTVGSEPQQNPSIHENWSKQQNQEKLKNLKNSNSQTIEHTILEIGSNKQRNCYGRFNTYQSPSLAKNLDRTESFMTQSVNYNI